MTVPESVDPVLHLIVQDTNDAILANLTLRIANTGTLPLSELDRHRGWVRIAADLAREVAHLNTDPQVMAAILAAEAWADDPSDELAEAAGTQARATLTATHPAGTIYTKETWPSLSAADAAIRTAFAAVGAPESPEMYVRWAVLAAVGAIRGTRTDQLALAHRAIDKFEELISHTAAPTPVAS